jgi:hypothetical protein
MTSQRPPATERLARFRKKDAVLDGLLSGALLAPTGAANDERLMTLLLYRCFKMDEVIAIMGTWPHGDLAERVLRGDRYYAWLRRKILAIGEFAPARRESRHASQAHTRAHVREQSGNSAREK